MKRKISIFTAVFFIIALFEFVPSINVQAYSNASYMSDTKVGLESMADVSLKGKTTGIYYINDTEVQSGTVFDIKITHGKVNINGKEYESVNIVPKDYYNLFSITKGNTTNRYMGSISFKIMGGKIYPVNSLPIEDYLKGVIGYEMADSYPMEALKAQAVAARTYALKHKGDLIKTKGYDFNDTIYYQVYMGYNPNFKNVEKAVKDTLGQVISYKGSLIDALFSSSHGGYTENAANVWGNYVPYLLSKQDILNGQAIDNASWGSIQSFTSSNIEENLKSKGYISKTDKFIKLDLNSIKRYLSGRVANIDVIYKDKYGNVKTKSLKADQCRTFLPLKSSMWNLTFYKDVYTFTGKGFGHGLGMSQIGAKQRALLGQTYDKILKFYYDSVQIESLYVQPTLNASINLNRAYTGTQISLSAEGKGGTGRYLYKYVVTKDKTSVLNTGYINSSKYSFTPQGQGQYQFTVYIKDAQSSKEYDANQSLSFTVYDKVSTTNLTLASSLVQVGKPLNLTVQTNGGSGDLSYKYVVIKNGETILETPYTNNRTFTYTPNRQGLHQVFAYVKDNFDTKGEAKSISTWFNPSQASSELNITSLPLSFGKTSSDVKALQSALIKLGYSISSATGYFGSQTRAALISFQKSRGLKQTGILDQGSLNLINTALAEKKTNSNQSVVINNLPLYIGKSGQDVKALQSTLIKLGYKISSATGYFGTQTRAAVIAFQKKRNLSPTGIFDSTSLKALNNLP